MKEEGEPTVVTTDCCLQSCRMDELLWRHQHYWWTYVWWWMLSRLGEKMMIVWSTMTILVSLIHGDSLASTIIFHPAVQWNVFTDIVNLLFRGARSVWSKIIDCFLHIYNPGLDWFLRTWKLYWWLTAVAELEPFKRPQWKTVYWPLHGFLCVEILWIHFMIQFCRVLQVAVVASCWYESWRCFVLFLEINLFKWWKYLIGMDDKWTSSWNRESWKFSVNSAIVLDSCLHTSD